MDGVLIATIIGSSVAVGTGAGTGAWAIARSIGKLQGELKGVKSQMAGMNDRLDTHEEHLGRIDKRINGFLTNWPGNLSEEEEGD